jgi:hypothetical protein
VHWLITLPYAVERRQRIFVGVSAILLQTALKSSLNAAFAMVCLKSEKAKLLRPSDRGPGMVAYEVSDGPSFRE